MSFAHSLATTSATADPSTSYQASRANMNEPSSLVPSTELDHRVLEIVNTPVNFGVIDFFIDSLVNTVARAFIATQYMGAMEMKSLSLMKDVCTFITYGELNTRTIMTAIVYLSEVRLNALDMGERFCERLAVGALMLAHKTINEPSHHGSRWVRIAQTVFGRYFTLKDLNRLERELLPALDWKVMPTNTALLAHYHDFMRYAQRDTRASGVDNRAIRAQIRNAPTALPDLMYPDSPSDGYSSDDGSEIITPPVAAPHDLRVYAAAFGSHHSHTGRVGATPPRKNRVSPYSRSARRTASSSITASTSTSSFSSSSIAQGHIPRTAATSPWDDSLLAAKIHYYASDLGTVPSMDGSSPRYVPFSPSQRLPYRRERARAPSPPDLAPLQTPALPRSRPVETQRLYWPEETQRRTEDHPWRRPYQTWQSSMPGISADDKWGSFGLFRQ